MVTFTKIKLHRAKIALFKSFFTCVLLASVKNINFEAKAKALVKKNFFGQLRKNLSTYRRIALGKVDLKQMK